ncbi:transcriptional activator spt7 [Talaromyces proteolyticus]|uniref:SAGA complex subunit Spt7 n=1 Tax=Talaromyces proteolyticus TaxID=1131652 RepID=A0AAD4KJ31_9EURO|nr:transcriptional activator spt7 [Talaromyces proteolyticus]KAH8692690.1 transcriptional activator spt7 [Talaromyces proteolyticus]
MSVGQNQAWLPPGHLRPPDDHQSDARGVNGVSRFSSGARTPQMRLVSTSEHGSQAGNLISDAEAAAEEDPRITLFRDLYNRSESKINALFSTNGDVSAPSVADAMEMEAPEAAPARSENLERPPKKAARKIDDDDYDEYDDDEGSEEQDETNASPLKAKSAIAAVRDASPAQRPTTATNTPIEGAKEPKKDTLEGIRKKLEEGKKATEEAARRSFQTMFYTLENDHDAMKEQERLEESERLVEAEMSGQGVNSSGANANASTNGYGSLSNANLGASSLTLKNLIARIDMKRTMVQASDAELRSLMSEVRKNRSKWANEDKVGQEELYEAAEKVLSELKAMTEHSSFFLSRVNKREAPDYYTIIKHPMDLGSMTKKLKTLQYKSKQEFVDDLNLIWANCLKYNAAPEHFLRKHALYMRKETEKLVPLIPDITIRDRAEVEAEERRLQLAEMDGAEESDDEPIMSSRGRKAPGKSSMKGTAPSRQTPTGSEGPSGLSGSQPKNSVGPDADLPAEGSQNGLSTPPPGTLTPLGANGIGVAGSGSQVDSMDIEGFPPVNSVTGGLSAIGFDYDDPEYQVWKQVTKKDRALIAAERHKLFKGDKLNADEPALLRTKTGMQRWLKNQKQAGPESDKTAESNTETSQAGLAEGIEEEEEDKVIPDYYDVMSGIPDIPPHLVWQEDSQGNVVDNSEEFLHILPKGSFTQPDSKLSKRMDANMRQMQETRKICSKVGIVKQMQIQSQMYQNQFQKYQPEPFIEQDVSTHVMNDDGPVISPWVSKAALQRSVAKVLYHTGFEEYQPSALDAVTDIASEFFTKICETLKGYMESPKIPIHDAAEVTTSSATQYKMPYTQQEMILHTLSLMGTDVESLESYVKDDIERLGTKLGVIHDRMRAHFTELLRPALHDTGGDGSHAFNDGSEQFVGGDFAEDIDEDFFGFKEMGLDKEFGLASLSVPFHLLQNRMFNAHQSQNTSTSQTTNTLFPPPVPYPRVTVDSLQSHIGLVRNFFMQKLQAHGDEPLVEDLELPLKQRPSRPKLPASGKIIPPNNTSIHISPQKRPLPPSLAQASSKAGGTSEPSKKKAKKNNGTNADASSSMGPPGGGDLFGTSTTDGKSSMDGKAADKSNANPIAGNDTDATVNGGHTGVSDLGGEGSSVLPGDVDSQQNKANGVAMSTSNAENSGNQGAGMMSPESINGQA